MSNGNILVYILCTTIVILWDSKLGNATLIHKYNSLTDSAFPAVVSLVDTNSQEFQASLNDEPKTDKIFSNNITQSILSANLSPTLATPLNNTTDEAEAEYIVKAEPKPILSTLEIDAAADVKPTAEEEKVNDTPSENQEDLVAELNVPVLDVESNKPKPSETMPVFSEWAQKQLEEAERNKEQVNISAQNLSGRNKTVKGVNLKHHTSKNYASPDCNAKIIAANPESSSMSSVLSPLRDEYALNTCTSKIWFVVELCESIQAKRIDLANFELFSSSPKEFSISVSTRFPSRDWSYVGQFTAKDERTIQSFDLYPHLFGKYIKVEVSSHYGKEHFCPISLFRVYGTSEFEAFETENPSHPVLADVDEESDLDEALSPEERNQTELNLFGSARDAVMSIMKKAAEVLTKSVDKRENVTMNHSLISGTSNICRTPSHIIVCDNCSDLLYSELYGILSCCNEQLDRLMKNTLIKKLVHNTNVCLKYGLDFSDDASVTVHNDTLLFFESAFEDKYVVAVCNAFAILEKKVVLNTSFEDIVSDKSHLPVDSNDNNTPIVLETETLLPSKNLKEEFEKDSEIISGELNTKDLGTLGKEKLDNPINDLTNESLEMPAADVKTEAENISETQTVVDKTGDRTGDEIKIDEEQIQKNIYNIREETTEQNINVVEQQQQQQVVIEETTTMKPNNGQEQQITENFENMFMELEANDSLSSLNNVNTGSAGSATLNSQNVPKESILIRLSNRLKALERNMSLSGQYLEELSKRYRNKVEELHSAFDDIKTTILEESKNRISQDQKKSEEILLLQQQVLQLTNEIRTLTEEKNSIQSRIWGIVQFVLIITVIVYIVMELFYKGNRQIEDRKTRKKRNTIKRRKSVEGVSGHISPTSKKRRPSTEALNISGTYKDLLKQESKFDNPDDNVLALQDLTDGIWISSKIDKKKKRKKAQKSLSNVGLIIPNTKEIIEINSTANNLNNCITNTGNAIVMEKNIEISDIVKLDINNTNEKSFNQGIMPQANGHLESNKSIRLSQGFLRSKLYKSKTSRSSDKNFQHKVHSWEWYRRRRTDSESNPSAAAATAATADAAASHRNSPVSDIENLCVDDVVSDTNSVSGSLNSSVNSNNFLEKKDKNKAYFKRIFKRVF